MLPDVEIIEGCLRGKPAAQEMLYKKYSGLMMAICKRYAYTTFEAEDIFQEAFIRVFKSLDTYKGQGSFEGWMRQIFVNTALNHYHRNKKFYFHEETDDHHLEISDPNPDAIADLSAEDLTRLIASLPEGYRLVFNLYVIEGYSHKEISDLLNISEGTSKSQLFKAKAILKKLLQPYSNQPDYVNQ